MDSYTMKDHIRDLQELREMDGAELSRLRTALDAAEKERDGLQALYDLACESVASLQARADAAEKRVGVLEATIAKLPKTADGVVMTPGMLLWYWWEPQYSEGDPMLQWSIAPSGPCAPHKCYSTKEAAEAAALAAVKGEGR